MPLFRRGNALERSYDAIAEEYARQLYRELDGKPADRQLLDNFAQALAGDGRCLDLGCGPGHVTRYLAEQGVNVSGIDISTRMVKQARKLNPGLDFERQDMRRLDFADNELAAAVSLYSIIHIPPADLVAALLEYHRVLEPGGALLLAFHVGTGSEHLERWWDRTVDLDVYYHRTLDMVMSLQQAGFEQVSVYKRKPYPQEQAQTRRAFILAEALPGIPPARRSRSAALP